MLRTRWLVVVLAACGGRTVDAEIRLALAPTPLRAAPGCVGTTCTPTNLAGRIFSGGAMWGELGPDAFSITMIGADDTVIEDPSHGLGGQIEFSLLDGTAIAGRYQAPGGGSDPRPMTRMEFNYDYLDAMVDLPLGRFVVRTVFATEAVADDVVGTMYRGDLLIRDADDPAAPWEWCDAAGCAADRGALGAVHQVAAIVDYTFPGQGNPDYVPFAVPVSNELSLTGDELGVDGGVWSCTFDMTGAVTFATAAEDLADRAAVLGAFSLSYAPDQAHAGDDTPISVLLDFSGG